MALRNAQIEWRSAMAGPLGRVAVVRAATGVQAPSRLALIVADLGVGRQMLAFAALPAGICLHLAAGVVTMLVLSSNPVQLDLRSCTRKEHDN